MVDAEILFFDVERIERSCIIERSQHPTHTLVATIVGKVGETAVSQIHNDPYGCPPGHISAIDNQSRTHLYGQPPHEARGNRRIREVPSVFQPRQQTVIPERLIPLPEHFAGPFVNGMVLRPAHYHRHPDWIHTAGSNVSILSDTISAFEDERPFLFDGDPMRKCDPSTDTHKTQFLSRGIGTHRQSCFPSGPIGSVFRHSPSNEVPVEASFGAFDPQPSPRSQWLLHQLCGQGSPLAAGDDMVALEQSYLVDAVSVVEDKLKRHNPVGNANVGRPAGAADFIRRLVAARSFSPKTGASEEVAGSASSFEVGWSWNGLTRSKKGEGEQHDRKLDGSDFLRYTLEGKDSAPVCFVDVGGEESALGQTDANRAVYEETKTPSPIRFFDSGVEICISGRPLCSMREEGRPVWPYQPPQGTGEAKLEGEEALSSLHDRQLLSLKEHKMGKPFRSCQPPRNEEQVKLEREEALSNLHERQRSIWDQFLPPNLECWQQI